MNGILVLIPIALGLGLLGLFAFFWAVTTCHFILPYFGFFTPYKERRFLRFLTPWVSSVPRIM
jgi:cell division protein FtsW (lipid II flippase)